MKPAVAVSLSKVLSDPQSIQKQTAKGHITKHQILNTNY